MESQLPEIRKLDEILSPKLNGAKILQTKVKSLTSLGDNYGSTMLALTVTTKRENETETNDLNLVAKMVPTNQQLRDMFKSEITFIKENLIYTDVYPMLVDLQRERGIPDSDIMNLLPNSFGARISLDAKSKMVDDDALLLLENLKFKGFRVGDRVQGFDYKHSLLILKSLANFHALPIALRYFKKDKYQQVLADRIVRIDMDDTLSDDYVKQVIVNIIKDISKCTGFDHLLKRVEKQIDKNIEFQTDITAKPVDSPFVTLVHHDFWVNNMMINYGESLAL